MKKKSLFIAFVGIFSTAIFANTQQQDPVKKDQPAKITKKKPVKRLAKGKAVELKKEEIRKEEVKSK